MMTDIKMLETIVQHGGKCPLYVYCTSCPILEPCPGHYDHHNIKILAEKHLMIAIIDKELVDES